MSGYNTISNAHGMISNNSSVNISLRKATYKRNQSPAGKSSACEKGNHDRCFKLNCTCSCNHPTK